MKAFAVMDRQGDMVAVFDSVGAAIETAKEEAAGAPVYFDGPGEDMGIEEPPPVEMALAANAGAARAAAKAMSACQLKAYDGVRDFEEIMEMDEDEAWERLRSYFPTRRASGRRLKAYDDAPTMAGNLLGQNYKTEKKTPRDVKRLVRERTGRSEATVMGLSLLPHTQVFNTRAAGGADVQDILSVARKRYGLSVIETPRANVCVRSTKECRASCLVFSGRNLADDYNTMKKYSLMQALYGDTEAFIRMLGRAIQRHSVGSHNVRKTPLVRLNVFSDIPWELVCPGIFSYFGDPEQKDAKRGYVQFYDYTKVPGRVVPDNYDITFSYAGDEENAVGMDHEVMESGRRVAVVFGLVGSRKEKGLARVAIPTKPPKGPGGFPEKFLGLKVVDGDKSDLRPYDPAPSVVALRWKIPANQGATLVSAGAFVVRGALVEGQFICAETPIRTRDYAAFADEESE